MRKKLSIIVPAFNEERTISTILLKLKTVQSIYDIDKEIIVVNDASKDNTISAVEQFMLQHPDLNINLVSHSHNKGKGAALRTGIEHATGDYVIVQDADLEYDPNEFDSLLKLFMAGVADVVYGSRFRGGEAHRILFFWHSIGNKMLTTLSNMLTNLNLTDMETCYKMFRREIIQSLQLKENRFGFEPEVTAKISKIKGVRIYEVAISYYGRTYAEGKKINWKDGFRAIYCIVKYNLFTGKNAFKDKQNETNSPQQNGKAEIRNTVSVL
jgi:glycosyltransferase involved in cell wall biosynthesis